MCKHWYYVKKKYKLNVNFFLNSPYLPGRSIFSRISCFIAPLLRSLLMEPQDNILVCPGV